MEGSVVPNNRGRPRSPPLHRGVLNFSPKLWPRQTAARLNRLQQQEAHQTQLAEVARKQKAAADAYAIAEAAKQAAAENTLHIEVERTEIETAIKDLQQKAETIRREEQKANAKLNRLNKNNKEQKPKERDLGAAEAYFGTAAEDPIDGLLIKTAHTAPKSRCSSENCADPSCPSSQNFCHAFNGVARAVDRRRQLEKKKKQQPLIINDNVASDDDRLSSEAIRNIYIDPEEVDGAAVPFAESQFPGELKEDTKAKNGGKSSNDAAEKLVQSIEKMAAGPEDTSEDEENELEEATRIKINQDAAKVKASMKAEMDAIAIRRPLRMTAVGTMQPLTGADKTFIQTALKNDYEVAYQQRNPKTKGSEPEGKESWRLYEKFKKAKSLREALTLGAEMKRIKDDYAKGFIRFPGRESIEPGHVFMADSEEASDLLSLLGINYDLHVGRVLRREEDDAFAFALESAEKAAEGVSAGTRKRFNEIIAACHDPVQTIKFLEDKKARMAFAEQYGLRLMATTSAATFLILTTTLAPSQITKAHSKKMAVPNGESGAKCVKKN